MNDEKLPLISIIIPVFNQAEYLYDCLSSVVSQSYKNLEIIIINDGSTDNSEQIIDKYFITDNRVKYYYQTNAGLSSARNYGINKSNGEFVSFVDSDDIIDHFCVEKLYWLLKKNNSEFSFCGYLSFVDKGNISKHKNNGTILYTSETEYWSNDDVTYTNKIVSWGKLYRKELFNNLCFDVNRFHEDEFIANKIISKCSSITYTKDKLYFYRSNQKGIVQSKHTFSRVKDQHDAIVDRIKYFRRKKYFDLMLYNTYYLQNTLFTTRNHVAFDFRVLWWKRMTSFWILKDEGIIKKEMFKQIVILFFPLLITIFYLNKTKRVNK